MSGTEGTRCAVNRNDHRYVRMHRLSVLIFFLLFLLFGDFFSSASALIVDRVLATVNGEIITYADYVRFTGNRLNMEGQDWVDEQMLRNLIEDRMMLFEAKKRGIGTSEAEVDKALEEFKKDQNLSHDDFEEGLRQEGLTLQMYRNNIQENITIAKLVHEEVDSKIFVTDKEAEDYFASHGRDFLTTFETREVKAIFLRLREGAPVTEITDLKRRTLEIVSRLKDGEDFDLLVEEYADEPLKSLGGRLGTFRRGTLVPALDEKAFAMGKGQTSGPIWVAEGVYILRVVNATDEQFKTFHEVRGEVRKILFRQKKEKLYKEWLKTLWDKTPVTINQYS
ncbi:MAG: SurA N-terminal domain-containing protein [Nitrospirota bacterium]